MPNLQLRYGGSRVSLLVGIIFLLPSIFSLGYGAGIFPYRDGTHIVSISQMVVGAIFLGIALTLLFFRMTFTFDKSNKEVRKVMSLNVLGLVIPLHSKTDSLSGYLAVRLRRKSAGNGTSFVLTLAGPGKEYWIFGTNDRPRMTKDAEMIAAHLALPLQTPDGL